MEPDPSIPGLLDLLTERGLPVASSQAATTSASSTAGRASTPATEQDPVDPFAEERPRTGERSVTGALRLRPDRGVVVRRDWVEVEI